MKKKVKTGKKSVKKPVKKSVRVRVKQEKEKDVKLEVHVEEVVDFAPQGETYWRERSLDDPHKDWGEQEGTWLDGYVESKTHPHRWWLTKALWDIKPFSVVAEIGCNVGSNLGLARETFPSVEIRGIDANPLVVKKANDLLHTDKIVQGSFIKLPWDTQSVDVLISDAVLIYATPEEFTQVLKEIDRVTKNAVVLFEWYSEKEEVVDYHWARNYPELFLKAGFPKCFAKKLTSDIWPSKNWSKNGYMYVFQRA